MAQTLNLKKIVPMKIKFKYILFAIAVFLTPMACTDLEENVLDQQLGRRPY
jgi:hypothetical protein